MNLMCERAEMFGERIYDHNPAVFEYFGLSFDGGRFGVAILPEETIRAEAANQTLTAVRLEGNYSRP